MSDIARKFVFATGVSAFLIAVVIVSNSGILQNSETTESLAGTGLSAPGIGIRSLSLINLLLAYALTLIVLEWIPAWQRVAPKFQGVITIVLSLIGLGLAIATIIKGLALFFTMFGMFLSAPFGTAAYFAIWGSFPTAVSKTILGSVMSLQTIALLTVFAVNPTLLNNRAMIALGGTVVLMTIVMGLLHKIPPGFFVSMTDAIGAVIAGIVAAIWMILFLISGIGAALRAVRGAVPV